MRNNLLNTLLILLVGVLPTNISAQNKWVDPAYIIEGKPFLTSKNPGGLIWMDSLNVSQIDLSFNKINGGLVNYHESDDALKAMINAKSIYRFTPKLIVQGGIDYTYQSGKNASGSVFLHPEQNAFDICEFTDEFAGRKVLEQYHILAEIGYNVWKGLIIGASFDFTSANYSKMKDLRYSSTYSNINFDFSTTYRFNDIVSLGLTYHHIKRVEGIYFKRYSQAANHYEVLMSYGSFWGRRKTYDDTEGLISNRRTPMHNRYNGGSLQLEVNPTENFSLFLEGECLARKGSLGLYSPNTIMYNTFTGLDYGVSLSSLFKNHDSRHLVRLGIDSKSNDLKETVYQIKTTTTGGSIVEYYDPVNVGNNGWFTYHLGYRGDFKVHDYLPSYTFVLDADIKNRDKKGILYPYYHDDRLWYLNVDTRFDANFIHKKNLFTASIGLAYMDGLLHRTYEGSYIEGATQIKAKESPMMRGRELEYLTNSQILVNPRFRYSRMFKKMTAFAEIDYAYRRSLEKVEFLTGNQNHNVLFTLGLIL